MKSKITHTTEDINTSWVDIFLITKTQLTKRACFPNKQCVHSLNTFVALICFRVTYIVAMLNFSDFLEEMKDN